MSKNWLISFLSIKKKLLLYATTAGQSKLKFNILICGFLNWPVVLENQQAIKPYQKHFQIPLWNLVLTGFPLEWKWPGMSLVFKKTTTHTHQKKTMFYYLFFHLKVTHGYSKILTSCFYCLYLSSGGHLQPMGQRKGQLGVWPGK